MMVHRPDCKVGALLHQLKATPPQYICADIEKVGYFARGFCHFKLRGCGLCNAVLPWEGQSGPLSY